MKFIPFLFALALCCCMVSCGGGGAPPGAPGLPQARTPAGEIPEVRAWFGRTPLVVGADSACSLPVVVFPKVAELCEHRSADGSGCGKVPVGVSLDRGEAPLVAYSHVLADFGAPVQGLIGWPVVRRFVWHLELGRSRHSFHTAVPQDVTAQGWRNLPLVRDSNVARVHLPGCGVCILDTGAPYGVYLSHAEWLHFLAEHPGAEIGIYIGTSPAAGGFFSHPYTFVRELRLGPLVLHNVRVCESFSPMLGPRMLGREALAQFDIWVDGPAARVYYRPAE